MNKPLLFSLDEASEFLGIGKSTVYKLVKDGKLQVCKIYNRTLIRRAELEDLVAGLADTRVAEDELA